MSQDKCIIYCEAPPMMGGGPTSGSKGAAGGGTGGASTVSAGKFKNIEVTDTGTIKKIKNKLFLGNQIDTYLLNVTKMSGFTLDVGNNCIWYGASGYDYVKWKSTDSLWQTQSISHEFKLRQESNSQTADAIGTRYVHSYGLKWTWQGTDESHKI